jgi:hypothetical protein
MPQHIIKIKKFALSIFLFKNNNIPAKKVKEVKIITFSVKAKDNLIQQFTSFLLNPAISLG